MAYTYDVSLSVPPAAEDSSPSMAELSGELNGLLTQLRQISDAMNSAFSTGYRADFMVAWRRKGHDKAHHGRLSDSQRQAHTWYRAHSGYRGSKVEILPRMSRRSAAQYIRGMPALE